LNKLHLRIDTYIHGKHITVEQGRTEESKTHGAQKTQSRKASEGTGLSAWLEEAESEEVGARSGEAVSQFPAFGNQHSDWAVGSSDEADC
jgi:hypothetical protein